MNEQKAEKGGSVPSASDRFEMSARMGGRFFVAVGVSVFMLADYIFHARREVPALVIQRRESTARSTRTFGMPDPLVQHASKSAVRAA